jgi:hypothetical protein
MEFIIPEVVFQVLLSITCLLFIGTWSVYFARRNKFPIKQRLSRIVLVEFILFAVAGIESILVAAFPANSFFANCKVFQISLTLFNHLPVLMLSYRICWVVIKDFATKTLVELEKKKFPSLVSVAVPQPEKTANLQCVEWMLARLLRIFSVSMLSGILLLPSAIIALVDIYNSFTLNYISGQLIWDPSCYTESFVPASRVKLGVLIPLLILIMIALSSISRIEENFGLKKEIWGMLGMTLILVVLTISNVFEQLTRFMMVETRIWFLICGIIGVPGEFLIQGVYPIVLSFWFERDESQYYLAKRHKESSTQTHDKPLLQLVSMDHVSMPPVEQLERAVGIPEARDLFLLFLRKEFSVENLVFYDECVQFRTKFVETKMTGSDKAWQELGRIVTTFVELNGASSVNLSFNTRLQILKTYNGLASAQQQEGDSRITSIPGNILEDARDEILHLMAKDSFLRFRMTPEYRTAVPSDSLMVSLHHTLSNSAEFKGVDFTETDKFKEQFKVLVEDNSMKLDS